MILLGYIPVTKLDCLSLKARKGAAYRLFHYSMSVILKPLIEAGKNGVDIVCADNQIRKVYPILAAYIADFPEQCLVATVKENDCPLCEIDPDHRGEPFNAPFRDPARSLEALRSWGTQNEHESFTRMGLRPVPEPFWADLPHTNIFTCFTPDLLHQLHKGVFKDHLVKWCLKMADGGAVEIDRRFKCMPNHPAIRHFHKGISTISQWTGREYKEMERVFASLIWGAVPNDVCVVARAVIDFIYYASFHSHTTETLWRLQDALNTFHEYKDVFIRYGIREHFRIPKIHAMEHYVSLIRLKGTADGTNTEQSERLHIDCVKEGYRASNKKDYIDQMIRYLERREAIHYFNSFLIWRNVVGEDEDDRNEEAEAEGGAEMASTTSMQPVNDEKESEETEVIQGQGTLTWRIPKKPSFPRTSVTRLIEDFGAIDIIPALIKYLETNVPACRVKPNEYDQFDVFKRIKADLPSMQRLDDGTFRDIVRAVPKVPAKGRKPAEPAHFDCVLVHDSPDAEDVGLNGECDLTANNMTH